MDPIKKQLSSLVQDVIDGNESAVKAMMILFELKSHINECQKQIEDLAYIENMNNEDGNNKDIHK